VSLRDSKIFQLMTAGADLVRETEWVFIYQKNNHQYRISKFLDDNFSVDAAVFRKQWHEMSPETRSEFCSAFNAKATWTSNETEILDLILADGDDSLWWCLSLTLLKHPDRERILNFLIGRLGDPQIEHGGGTLNYIQALGISGDRRAAAAIKPYYEEFKQAVKLEAQIGVPSDVVFGPIPYHAYFAAAGAMAKTDDSPEYENAIREYFNHPSEQVRYWAEHALGVGGPATLKRNEEYRRRLEE
jgi:hypothetical protein